METKINFASPLRIITNAEEYEKYLTLADEMMDLELSEESEEGRYFETLILLIEDYERKMEYELPEVNDPIATIRVRMNDLGLKNKDLEPAIGSKGYVSQVLRGKRNLTVDMIRKLAVLLQVPVAMLIKKVDVDELSAGETNYAIAG